MQTYVTTLERAGQGLTLDPANSMAIPSNRAEDRREHMKYPGHRCRSCGREIVMDDLVRKIESRHTSGFVHDSCENALTKPETACIDFSKNGGMVTVEKFTRYGRKPFEKYELPRAEFERRLEVLRKQGWTIREWGAGTKEWGVRAYNGKPFAIRFHDHIRKLRQSISNEMNSQHSIYTGIQLHTLDLAIDGHRYWR